MDVFAHFFWSWIIFYRYGKLRLALLFGVLPDILSWGVYSGYRLFMEVPFGPPIVDLVPDWTWTLYGITHSQLVFWAVVGIIWLIYKKVPWYLYAWGINTLVDIPTHSRAYLPTPFLWPLSDYAFPGFSWGNPLFMFVNYFTILTLLFITFRYKKNIFGFFMKNSKNKVKKKTK